MLKKTTVRIFVVTGATSSFLRPALVESLDTTIHEVHVVMSH
jgi:hypothetical protein